MKRGDTGAMQTFTGARQHLVYVLTCLFIRLKLGGELVSCQLLICLVVFLTPKPGTTAKAIHRLQKRERDGS